MRNATTSAVKKLLVIQCTPRDSDSNTMILVEHFIAALQGNEGLWEIERLNLWSTKLPEMSGELLDAKYAYFEGRALTDEQALGWAEIAHLVAQFSQADLVLLAMPIWNLNIPYRLKHYIDVITQPGLSFSWSPEEGYQSLLNAKTAVVLNSSGQRFGPGSGNESMDFGLPYIKSWLGTFMNCEVKTVSFAPAVGDEIEVRIAREQACKQAANLAKNFI